MKLKNKVLISLVIFMALFILSWLQYVEIMDRYDGVQSKVHEPMIRPFALPYERSDFRAREYVRIVEHQNSESLDSP